MKQVCVTKEFSFDCAHVLTGHDGLCRNLHGHTYKVLVSLKRKEAWPTVTGGAQDGMVVDFKRMKEILNENLFGQMDHAFIYNEQMAVDSGEMQLADLVGKLGMRCYAFPGRTTAENMSQFFCDEINRLLTPLNLVCTEVQVFETPTSYATCKEVNL